MKKRLTFYFILGIVFTMHSYLVAQNFNIEYRSEMEFPGQTVANVWGYTDADANEYALVGTSNGMSIVNVTDPENPQLITQIPGPNSLWKEIRTYGHYAYVATEGGGGIQIVDLSGLPSPTLDFYSYTGAGLNTIHALQVDETKGFLYLYGSNLFNGGAFVLDLNDDPYNPTIAGSYNSAYIHDGFADNDTLYAAQINNGNMTIIDFTDKSNPVILAVQQTPGNFTHNTWPSADRNYILTTDEVSNSYLTSYDISDLGNIEEIDRFQTAPGSGAIVHNTEVLGDFAITSWYTEGVSIVDFSRPDNLIEVAKYDTYPGSGGGFDGCWGAYPYFPSGTIVAGNITPGKIYVLSPTYIYACYLEGLVTDATTGNPVNNVNVSISGGDALSGTTTDPAGIFKTGQVSAGTFTVNFTRAGYLSQSVEVNLVNGELTYLEIQLEPLGTFAFNGLVQDSETGAGIPNAKVLIKGTEDEYELTTNASGQFNINNVLSDVYQVYAGIWGWHEAVQEGISVTAPTTVTLTLEKGYKDDFLLDLGWTLSGSASQGAWEIGEPVGFDAGGGLQLSPELDVQEDLGDQCYITGNQGSSFNDDDVAGETILTSPPMDLSGLVDAKITYYTWFVSGNEVGPATNDTLKVQITNGTTTVNIGTRLNEFPFLWKMDTVHLAGLIDLTDNMRIIFRAKDIPDPGAFLSILECGLDAFLVEEGMTVGNNEINQGQLSVKVFPNPYDNYFELFYQDLAGDGQLEVVNNLGQVIEKHRLDQSAGSMILGRDWPAGIYHIRMTDLQGKLINTSKVIKQ